MSFVCLVVLAVIVRCRAWLLLFVHSCRLLFALLSGCWLLLHCGVCCCCCSVEFVVVLWSFCCWLLCFCGPVLLYIYIWGGRCVLLIVPRLSSVCIVCGCLLLRDVCGLLLLVVAFC